MANRCTESKEEFEARYKQEFPDVAFGKDHMSIECTCEDGGGPTHWAAVPNSPEAIKDHLSHESCLAYLQ